MSEAPPDTDPLELFRTWLDDAERHEPTLATACALGTADATGRPSVRMVLLKGMDEHGFSFFTNHASAKADDLAVNPRAALTFHWKSVRRQVRIEGTVERVSDAESDTYFATRPRSSQLAAWASEQSRVLPDRSVLDQAVAREVERHGDGPVPRPPFWGGYRIRPERIEFWQEGSHRLHRRWEYRRSDGAWIAAWLWP